MVYYNYFVYNYVHIKTFPDFIEHAIFQTKHSHKMCQTPKRDAFDSLPTLYIYDLHKTPISAPHEI